LPEIARGAKCGFRKFGGKLAVIAGHQLNSAARAAHPQCVEMLLSPFFFGFLTDAITPSSGILIIFGGWIQAFLCSGKGSR